MNGQALDFDPTFELDPEDYACDLDTFAAKLAARGDYTRSELCTGAAKWIRRLAEEVQR